MKYLDHNFYTKNRDYLKFSDECIFCNKTAGYIFYNLDNYLKNYYDNLWNKFKQIYFLNKNSIIKCITYEEYIIKNIIE